MELAKKEHSVGEALSVADNFKKVTDAKEGQVALNYDKALASYTEEERREIIELSDEIDVRKTENLMYYGSEILASNFEQCGKFLKDERGSAADQEVIAQVIALSKKAKESYDDFNLVIKDPTPLQQLFMSIFTNKREARERKIQQCATTNYKLLIELQKSCETWRNLLNNAMTEITGAIINDKETAVMLEKYIIAGNLATARIEDEISEARKNYETTGLQQHLDAYEELKDGYDIFQIALNNLERSRIANQLSVAQLRLIERSNLNVQIAINTQQSNSMDLLGQQLRNGVLNAKTKAVLEGQKAIARLNDELMKEVSNTISMTVKGAEKAKYAGFYNIDAAKAAVKIVIETCDSAQKAAEEMLPEMKRQNEELTKLLEQLEPYADPSKAQSFSTGNKHPNMPSGRSDVKKLKF